MKGDYRKYREREYELLEEIENGFSHLEKNLKQLRREVDYAICEIEVDHFLEHGPGGVDPD
jgi:hypothetical protein